MKSQIFRYFRYESPNINFNFLGTSFFYNFVPQISLLWMVLSFFSLVFIK